MDFNPLEEASPFAPFWHSRNHGFGDARSSPESLASQSLQADDNDNVNHLGSHQPDGPVEALTTTSLRDVATFPSTSPDRQEPQFDGDAIRIDSDSDSEGGGYTRSDSDIRDAANNEVPEVPEVPGATAGRDAESPPEAPAQPPAQDRMPSPIVIQEEEDLVDAHAHAASAQFNSIGQELHGAHLTSPSSPPRSSAHVVAEPTPSRSTASKPSSPASEAEPRRVEEEDSALEAQIHQEESFAHSPRQSPAPAEPIEAESREETVERPAETIEDDLIPAVEHVEKADEPYQAPEISPDTVQHVQEPIQTSLPERRRQSPVQALQTDAKEQADGGPDETFKQRASAPAARVAPGPIAIEIPASRSHSPKPEPAAKQAPAKRGRPRKSEPILSSTKRPQGVVKTPLRARPARTKPQSATTARHMDTAKDAATTATPATARRGRPPSSAVKTPGTTETFKRRGRPPKSATTPAAAPKTPASQKKRPTVEAAVSGTGEKAAKSVRGSTQRQAPSSRTSVRVVSRTPIRTPKPRLSASTGKRRGRPPKDVSKTQVAMSKSEEKTRPTRGTGRLAAVPLPRGRPTKQPSAPVDKSERTRAAQEETSEAPAKKRGRQPKEVVEEPPVKKQRGRQSKTAEAQKATSTITAELPAVKRRGRPPAAASAAAATGKSAAKSTAATTKSQKAAVEAGGAARERRGRPSAVVSAVSAPATEKPGLIAAKKRGRPSRGGEVAEEPKAKRLRAGGAGEEVSAPRATAPSKAATTGPGRRARHDAVKPVPSKPVDAPSAEKMQRGRGRQAAAAEAPPPVVPAGRGRPKAQEADARPRGRPARGAAPTQGPVAKASRPQGIVKKTAVRGARGPQAAPGAGSARRATRLRG